MVFDIGSESEHGLRESRTELCYEFLKRVRSTAEASREVAIQSVAMSGRMAALVQEGSVEPVAAFERFYARHLYHVCTRTIERGISAVPHTARERQAINGWADYA